MVSKARELRKVAQQERAVDEEHCVIVGKIQHAALALVDRDQQRGFDARSVQEGPKRLSPAIQVCCVLLGELKAEVERRRSDRIEIPQDEGDDPCEPMQRQGASLTLAGIDLLYVLDRRHHVGRTLRIRR